MYIVRFALATKQKQFKNKLSLFALETHTTSAAASIIR